MTAVKALVAVLGSAAALGAARPRIEADGWVLNAEVECGNAASIERVATGRFAVAPREDPLPIEVQKTGPISNYAVYFEITNRARERRELVIEVRIPEWLIRDKFDYFLRKYYVVRTPEKLEWQPVEPVSLKDRVEVKLELGPGERKILSTTEAYPYSKAVEKLRELARRSKGRARVREIGKSVEGRAIWSLEAGDKSKPRAVFSATLQSGEPSAWAILAMAEAAVADGELLRRWDLAFVPMTNPDGVVNGSNNVNSKGEIAMLGFEAAARGVDGPQEARVLWKYLAQKPPRVLIDFHFLRLPNHPLPRPYVFTPALWSDPGRRELGVRLARRLEALTGAPEGPPIAENHPMWKFLATYHSIKEWNTVATLYQYTGPKTSWREAQARGVEVMRTALEVGAGDLPGRD